MANNRASWRRHLRQSAITASTPLDKLPPPHYGPGHNLPPATSDLSTALRRDIKGYMLDFVNQPRVDVDPNIGLSLLMGLNDKLTIRRQLTSQEFTPNAIDPNMPVRQVVDHIEREQMLGKKRTVIVLRFPGVHMRGSHFNPTAGAIDADMIEMPVVIDITPNAIDEWSSKLLAHDYEGTVGKTKSDKVAQQYGFANARDMQNSRPLGLNNNWLRRNEHVGTDTAKSIKTIERGLRIVEKRIATQKGKEADMLAKLTDLHENGPNEDMLKAASDIEILTVEAQPIKDAMTPLLEREAELRTLYSTTDDEEMRKTILADIRAVLQDLHPLHLQLQPIAQKITRASQRTAPVLEQKWQGQLATYRDETIRLERIQQEDQQELERLQSLETTAHHYVETDHNPTLFTMKVLAANPRDYIREINANPAEPIAGKPKHIQEIYRTDIYPYALDNRPNGWLKDALGTSDDGRICDKADYKPDNSYIRATRRYFMHLYEQAKGAGGKYASLSAFANDPESVLGAAINHLNTSAMSDPALAANWRDKVNDGERGTREVA